MRVLVTGGVRSGKSRHAETLLGGSPATYVAPGPAADDADWAERIAAHRARRPAAWTTLETHDLAAALATPGPVIVDCLGAWLTAQLDDRGLWDAPSAAVVDAVETLVEEAVTALAARHDPTVLVTNEVGLGVVPAHRSGRLFRDLLGLVNQRTAAACDQVHLVIAGRVLVL
ncbi:bifunctional adenosylcobinamide kinase/adenosylcobinamide-phosphate guanylyltransferase [Nocardioides sp.]|uniref:bifunctional adenosylcobinamide kinase/adenosylcobinamide-phosphate guanylyltransferase n=1 Tax=Nocardioides sp. TaxID=35761 RepID=UPI002BFE3927|nr:bifunctional adenosylcobinamide kinase/adenosylcobinamide-phosphate guanylyltransferase [Nocardioides sp.]HVX53365.1 bifunctional adenosylcobinamide kinase/adenosylcobinamide-phosphate guanylyltransferase [Nocardioides sp.]